MQCALLKQELDPSPPRSSMSMFSFGFLRGFLYPDNACFLKILKISPHPLYRMTLADDSGFGEDCVKGDVFREKLKGGGLGSLFDVLVLWKTV